MLDKILEELGYAVLALIVVLVIMEIATMQLLEVDLFTMILKAINP